MIDLIKWALHKRERSKDAATKRLQLILVLDRIGMAPDQLEAMRRDLLQAVSKHLVVDEESLEMDIQRSEDSLVLVSNIQVQDVIKPVAAG